VVKVVEMPRFGSVRPKHLIEEAAADDGSVTNIDLGSNALFKMKTFEYCMMLAESLASNHSVTTLNLCGNEITDVDCEWIKKLLQSNTSITSLNLEGNKVSSDGCALIAEGLAGNSSLTALNLLNQGPFGESCMDSWLETFNSNITLTDLKWRISSRSSFALNAALTRNRSIQRLRAAGKDWRTLLPDGLRE